MQALVLLKLVLGLGVWLVLRVFASQPSILANYSLVLLLQQSFDCEQVDELGLSRVRLVVGLVAGTFSQLGSLSIGIILRLWIGETVWASWIV